MARRSQHLGHRPGLHDGAAIHDAQVVAELGDEAELVRDEDDRPGETAAQVFQQRHDLRFHRRIQRGGGLVGEQQVRLDQQRHGDQHALAHAAGELVRIGREAQRRIGDADALAARRSRAPRRPFARDPGWRRRSTSTRCVPIVKSGLSAVIGSWKIMAIRVPRQASIAASGRARRSVPSNTISPSMRERFAGSRRTRHAARLDLPDPDSPTTPTMRRRPMSRSMPRRMRAVPRARRRFERQLAGSTPAAATRQNSCRMRGSTASRSASPNSVKPSVATASARLETTTGTQLSDRYW